MGANSGIQWTHHTFNPWTGCARVSPGCQHCYAETLAKRAPRTFGQWGHAAERRVTSDANWRKPLAWDRAAAAAGERHRVFSASLADVFEARVDLEEPRYRLFELIRATPSLDWLLLTKRADYAHWWLRRYVGVLDQPRAIPNLWLGTSVEDQRRAEERIPLLIDTPAAVRFLSMEPLLGPVDLDLGRCEVHGRDHLWDDPRGEQRCGECAAEGWAGELSYDHWLDPLNGGIDWVIVGGESGPGARPMDIGWARSIVSECRSAGVPVFVKQLGARPRQGHMLFNLTDQKGGDPDEWPPDLRIREYPEVAS